MESGEVFYSAWVSCHKYKLYMHNEQYIFE